jgi:hypothetical protein
MGKLGDGLRENNLIVEALQRIRFGIPERRRRSYAKYWRAVRKGSR